MVLSRLNNTIDYPDMQKVDEEDIDFNSALYIIDINKIDIIIALGNIRYSFVTKGVLYVPMYMVVKDRVVSQLGVFECLNSDYTKLLDDDNDIDLNLLDPPLLYSFATKEYITSLQGKEEAEEEEAEEEEAEEAEEEEEAEEAEEADEEEEEDEALNEKSVDENNEMSKENWVSTFLDNGNYNVVDNEGGGDCLFASIRDAFETTKSPHSVGKQRALLTAEVTQETYDNYKTIYNDLLQELANKNKEIKAVRKKFNKVKKLHKKNISDKDKGMKYSNMAGDLRKKFATLKTERNNTKRIIEDEFKMMKGLNTLGDFKKLIQTCEFWGDIWAISTLERILNIKLIILSSHKYHQNDLKNVLQCGELAEAAFHPRYYIILDYTGNHYKLITYKDRRIFTFKELPYGLVKLISKTCMGGEGVFDKISAFKKFKNGEEDST